VRQAGYRVACAEDAFVHHFGEASFGELVPTGRYGELFRANKARFEEKWGVYVAVAPAATECLVTRDLVERIRSLVEHELPPDANRARSLERRRPLLELGAERRGWHFPQMEDGTYAGYHHGDSAEAICALRAPPKARRGVCRCSRRLPAGGWSTTATSRKS
jgi:hypothetical protein